MRTSRRHRTPNSDLARPSRQSWQNRHGPPSLPPPVGSFALASVAISRSDRSGHTQPAVSRIANCENTTLGNPDIETGVHANTKTQKVLLPALYSQEKCNEDPDPEPSDGHLMAPGSDAALHAAWARRAGMVSHVARSGHPSRRRRCPRRGTLGSTTASPLGHRPVEGRATVKERAPG